MPNAKGAFVHRSSPAAGMDVVACAGCWCSKSSLRGQAVV